MPSRKTGRLTGLDTTVRTVWASISRVMTPEALKTLVNSPYISSVARPTSFITLTSLPSVSEKAARLGLASATQKIATHARMLKIGWRMVSMKVFQAIATNFCGM